MAVKKKAAKAVEGKKLPAKASAKGKALARPEDLEARFAAEAAQEAERLPTSGGSKLSIRGGEFTYKGASLGESLEVIILGFRYENAWYGGLPYDQENPSIPACFAIAADRIDLKPCKNAPEPQTEEDCSVCEYGQWGSAETGRGKACKDQRRVALMHVSDLEAEDPSDIEIVILNVPPTSVKNFDKYAKGINKLVKRPLYGVVTKLAFDDDSDYEVLTFDHVRKIEVNEIDIIDTKREEADEMLDQEYDPTGYVSIEERMSMLNNKKRARPVPVKKAAPKKSGAASGGKSRFAK